MIIISKTATTCLPVYVEVRDNAAVVAIVNSGTSRDQDFNAAFIMAKFNFLLVAPHIKGIENDLADALSRDNMHPIIPRQNWHRQSSLGRRQTS